MRHASSNQRVSRSLPSRSNRAAECYQYQDQCLFLSPEHRQLNQYRGHFIPQDPFPSTLAATPAVDPTTILYTNHFPLQCFLCSTFPTSLDFSLTVNVSKVENNTRRRRKSHRTDHFIHLHQPWIRRTDFLAVLVAEDDERVDRQVVGDVGDSESGYRWSFGDAEPNNFSGVKVPS